MVVASLTAYGFISKNNINKAEGYSHEKSLPQTIDLKDNTVSDIKTYYQPISQLTPNQRQGDNLLIHLKDLLKTGQKYYSYDDGNCIWQLYEIADRDWEKSPASSTTYGTYNPSTNKITGYVYGSSKSSSKNNPYIHALYINREVENLTTAWDDHNQDEWGINREHVWPKSHGFGADGEMTETGGARGDPMHLWAGNGYSNNKHSNYFYGFVDKSKTYTDCGSKYSNQKGNLLGISLSKGSGTVFEPQDCDKGDIARSVFYMAARYNYLSGSDSDGIDANNPNLLITDSSTDPNGTSKYDSTTTKTGNLGVIRDLLAWNRLDPPDEYEIHRNNLLFNNYTNNRNPFIDYPEWAEYIWGSVELASDNRRITSYVTTPTGSADPENDVINGYNTGASVSISETDLQLVSGETFNISATSSDSSTITWSTSNSGVASISSTSANSGASITISAKSTGSATITARASIGGQNYTKTCNVTVSASKELDTISIGGYKTNFLVGDSFVFGGTVTAHFTDGSSSNVTDLSTFSGYNMSSTGAQTVTVSYTYKGITKTQTYTINISSSSIISTGIVIADYASEHGWENSVKYETIEIDSNVTASIGESKNNNGKYYVSGNDWRFYQSGNGAITISAAEDYIIDEITFTFTTQYNGVLLDSSSNAVQSGSTVAVNSNSVTYTVGNTGSATNGQVRFNEISLSYHKEAAVPTLTGITLDTTNVETNFKVGDTFSYDGLVVTAHYSDLSSAVVTPTSVSSPDMSSAGTKTITVTYEDQQETYEIKVSNFPYLENIAYKLSFTNSSSATYYFSGSIANSYYLATSSTYSEGVYVYFEENGEGYNIYFDNSGTKTYIYVYTTTSGTKTYVDLGIQTNVPTDVWKYSEQCSSMSMTVGGKEYVMQGDNTYTTISGKEIGSETHIANIVETAESYSYEFLHSFTCDPTGENEPHFKTGANWNSLSNDYNALVAYERNLLTSSPSNKNGTIIQQCVARYDLVVYNHGYDNFMSRTAIGTRYMDNNHVQLSVIMIIIISSFTAISITGSIVLIKRKKSKISK